MSFHSHCCACGHPITIALLRRCLECGHSCFDCTPTAENRDRNASHEVDDVSHLLLLNTNAAVQPGNSDFHLPESRPIKASRRQNAGAAEQNDTEVSRGINYRRNQQSKHHRRRGNTIGSNTTGSNPLGPAPQSGVNFKAQPSRPCGIARLPIHRAVESNTAAYTQEIAGIYFTDASSSWPAIDAVHSRISAERKTLVNNLTRDESEIKQEVIGSHLDTRRTSTGSTGSRSSQRKSTIPKTELFGCPLYKMAPHLYPQCEDKKFGAVARLK
jgi:predicted  nucleic acid-binding Zn-ribbon protein